MNDQDRTLCAATAGLLRASNVICAWGLALSFIAAIVLALTGRSLSSAAWACNAAVAIAGLVERFLASRMRLDAEIFEGIAQGRIASLPDLDGALQRLGQRGAAPAPVSLVDRVQATRQVAQRHGLVVAAQTGLFALALAVQDWR